MPREFHVRPEEGGVASPFARFSRCARISTPSTSFSPSSLPPGENDRAILEHLVPPPLPSQTLDIFYRLLYYCSAPFRVLLKKKTYCLYRFDD